MNKPNRYELRQTPLHLAARGDHPELIRILVAHGATVDFKAFFDHTPLHEAALFGKSQAAKVLLELGADITGVPDELGYTPAFLVRNLDCMKAFIDAGFDINTRGSNGSTILHSAVDCGVAMVEYLLGQQEAVTLVNAQDSNGATPLHLTRDPDTISALMRHGADIEVKDNNGYSWFEKPVGYFSARRGQKVG